MANRLLLTLIIVTIFTALILTIFLTQFQNTQVSVPINTDSNNIIKIEQKEFTGEIQQLFLDSQSLIIKTPASQTITIQLTNQTKITDSKNAALTLSDLQKGFSIKVSGKSARSDYLAANQIHLTKQPLILVTYPKVDQVVSQKFVASGSAKITDTNHLLRLRIKNLTSNRPLYDSEIKITKSEGYNTFNHPIDLSAIKTLKKDDNLLLEFVIKPPRTTQEIEVLPINVKYLPN